MELYNGEICGTAPSPVIKPNITSDGTKRHFCALNVKDWESGHNITCSFPVKNV